jgi:hypothetical protein
MIAPLICTISDLDSWNSNRGELTALDRAVLCFIAEAVSVACQWDPGVDLRQDHGGKERPGPEALPARHLRQRAVCACSGWGQGA